MKTFDKYFKEDAGAVKAAESKGVSADDFSDEEFKGMSDAFNKSKEKSTEALGKVRGETAGAGAEQSAKFLTNVLNLIPSAGMPKTKFYNYIRKKYGTKKGPTQYIHLYLTSLYPWWLYISANRKFGKDLGGEVGSSPTENINKIIIELLTQYITQKGGKPSLDANGYSKNKFKLIEDLFNTWGADEKIKQLRDNKSGDNLSNNEKFKEVLSDEYKILQSILVTLKRKMTVDNGRLSNLFQLFSTKGNLKKAPVFLIPADLKTKIKIIKDKTGKEIGSVIKDSFIKGNMMNESKSFDFLMSTLYEEYMNEDALSFVKDKVDSLKGGLTKAAGGIAGGAEKLKGLITGDFNPTPPNMNSAFSNNALEKDVHSVLTIVNNALLKMKRGSDDTGKLYYHRLIKNIPLTLDNKSYSSDFFTLYEDVASKQETFGEAFYMLLQYINGMKIPQKAPILLMRKTYKKRVITDAQLSGYLFSDLGIQQPQLLGLIFNHMFDVTGSDGRFGKKILDVLSRFYSTQNPQDGEGILKNLESITGVKFEVNPKDGFLTVADKKALETKIKEMALGGKAAFIKHKIFSKDTALVQWIKKMRGSNETGDDTSNSDREGSKTANFIGKIIRGFRVDKANNLTFGNKKEADALFNPIGGMDGLEKKLSESFKKIFDSLQSIQKEKEDSEEEPDKIQEELSKEQSKEWKNKFGSVKLFVEGPGAKTAYDKAKDKKKMDKYFDAKKSRLYFIHKKFAMANGIENFYQLYKLMISDEVGNNSPDYQNDWENIKNMLTLGIDMSDEEEKGKKDSTKAPEGAAPKKTAPTKKKTKEPA